MRGSEYVESFNARLRDELLDGEVFRTVAEARVLIERWHQRALPPHGMFAGLRYQSLDVARWKSLNGPVPCSCRIAGKAASQAPNPTLGHGAW
jgi:hypothetical protein